MKVSTEKVVSVTIKLNEDEARELSRLIYFARELDIEGYETWMQQLEELIDDAIGNS